MDEGLESVLYNTLQYFSGDGKCSPCAQAHIRAQRAPKEKKNHPSIGQFFLFYFFCFGVAYPPQCVHNEAREECGKASRPGKNYRKMRDFYHRQENGNSSRAFAETQKKNRRKAQDDAWFTENLCVRVFVCIGSKEWEARGVGNHFIQKKILT